MKNIYHQYPLIVTNTLTQKKEPLVLSEKQKVLLYVCGITPYDYAHIGHGRVYVTFDAFYRLLRFLHLDVVYCRNFTDVDDKLINRACKEFNDAHKFREVADKYIDAYHADMKELGCLSPNFEPRVTDNLPEIITFVQELIDAGKAYVAGGDVYYSISSFSEYGKLSKRDISQLQVGARVEVRDDKKNPLDFALWKQEPTNEPGWQSPWGWGRPGWHIECSALAAKYLGETIDIHAGGMDLIFPHHENEIAQSEGLHDKTFARYWMHNAFVRINQEKMSKSLNNFVTLKDLLKEFNPMVIRYYYLNHHYRNPMDFSQEDIEGFAKSYHRLSVLFNGIQAKEVTAAESNNYPIVRSVIEAFGDDLNIAKAFGIIFDQLHALQENPLETAALKYVLNHVLGLTFQIIEKKVEITPEIQALINAREQARTDKNWALADDLRDQLKALGIEVQDKKK